MIEDLTLVDELREINLAVSRTSELIKNAPMPSRDDAVKLAYAHAVIFQQAAMALLVEAKATSGHKQIVRLDLAAKMGGEATKAFGLVMKHLPKGVVIDTGVGVEAAVDSLGVGVEGV